MTQLVIRQLASADNTTTRRWYERERRGAGDEFIQELDHVFARMRALPLQFPEVHRRIRRALLRRYPYAVFFVPRDTTIFVIAVLHQRREPNAWEKRIHAEEAG